MNLAVRNGLEAVRLIGGIVATASIAWILIDPAVRQTTDLPSILFAVFGLPAGASALLLKMDKDSEI